MQRYFIYFSYDGASYHGFQIQPNGNTVQAELQNALSVLLRRKVETTGAGRTDAGVHARCMAAHFDLSEPVDVRELAFRLNRILPASIAVDRIEEAGAGMHARFSARRRTYRYYIHTKKDPFLCRYSAELHCGLDFEKMNAAARHLLGTRDFAAFCKSHTDVKTTLCEVSEARWVQTSGHTWYFEITANRFLRNMVRAVVGTLIETGRGRMTVDGFDAVIEGRDRCAAGESMPAHALFLENVEY